MNDIKMDANKTPIEIALGMDNDGMCTARKLYEFLELDASHFSRWAKANITENEFATENEDWVRFAIDGETPTGGKITQDDYRLTAHFAKKLSMKGNGQKAEAAREYFTRIEEQKKQEIIDKSRLSPQTRLILELSDGIARMEIEQKEQAERIDKIEKRQEAIQIAVTPIVDNWREEINRRFNAIQKSCGTDFKMLRSKMYEELDRRAGVDIATRLRNRKDRMKLEGFTKSAINNLNRMDIIEVDKKLREIFSKIVSEYEIRCCQ